ncbi:NADH dehydrogenase [ubiquinone] 1 beta subcomplex subunit 2, mitochondrial-like [Biomphalaria glabrata]|uniref:NADH dehydrogenase [ubiquinone] 1 beta subcomplex subunit 2, mitochondrial-like n=1 Tax=Biomphalaria glabrata TaxID=6526 RepID=A0A9W3ASB4_BIOGL|nr:NADH dehydrogenase [ubiquinone] 1 beta subcomplex subunit 2, mitochondrial-like [Biomphalaria glabrata]
MISLLSRLRPIAATVCRQNNKSLSLSSVQKTSTRNAGTALYRRHDPSEPKGWHYFGEALSAFFWFWILYHSYYEFDHLVPHDTYPDPSKFTNEELGIPADDE